MVCSTRLTTSGFYVNKADKSIVEHISKSEGTKLKAGTS